MKIRWLPSELHTHTFHSDGQQTVRELALTAKRLGLECVALTDHNTISGHLECRSVMEETGIHIIRGMEWTTFFGHMLTLGISEYVDWRDLGIHDIHRGIQRVKRQGGIVGIAHPFRLGSPICTGCYWEFEVTDWHDINYIEVWSGLFPAVKRINQRAYKFWTERLNDGYRITAVSGRDWHKPDSSEEPFAVTYLGVNDATVDIEKAAIDAIRGGRVSVTMGPLLLCHVFEKTTGATYGIGETAILDPEQEIAVRVNVDFCTRQDLWTIPSQSLTVRVISNLGERAVIKLEEGCTEVESYLQPDGLNWIRAELYGRVHEVHTLIAFTNPIYIDCVDRSTRIS
jgi:hypothetical protein